MPIEPLKRLKPWMLAVTFEELEWQKAGYDPDLGLDKHFYDRAQAEGKAVQGFETAEFQLSLFDGMPMDQQDRMLAETLKDLDTEINNVNKLADAWKAGDAPAVERIVLPDLKQDPAMYKRLLVDRNATGCRSSKRSSPAAATRLSSSAPRICARIVGIAFAIVASCDVTPTEASANNIATSARSRCRRAIMTLSFSAISFVLPLRRMPAVSRNR